MADATSCANFLVSEGAERLETWGGGGWGAHLSVSNVHTYPPKPLCNLRSVYCVRNQFVTMHQ